MVRAQLPLRYSEGFNPRPRMSISLPRPVGVASSDEMLVVEMTEPIEGAEIARRLGAQMPEGMSIVSAEALLPTDRMLPNEAQYAAPLASGLRESVAARAKAVLEAPEHRVLRSTPDRTASPKSIDIRPYLLAIDVDEYGVRWRQRVTGTGTARISEVLDALGLSPAAHLHEVRREHVTFER